MGLDRFQKTPCGFCFVEYATHQQACDSMRFINGTKLDERLVRTDLDPGFKEGRQFGRGRSGGQVFPVTASQVDFRYATNIGRIMIPLGVDGAKSKNSNKEGISRKTTMQWSLKVNPLYGLLM
jgi:RNA recognition motif-containing protein